MALSPTVLTSVCLVLAITMVTPGTLYSQAIDQERFTLDLQAEDIHTLIETVSLRTGKNFIVDPRVKARVTVISSEPVNAEELYELFLSVLAVHGFAAVPAGNLVKIVPAIAGAQSAIPVVKQPSQNSDELVTRVVNVSNPAEPMIAVLRPLLPDSASISAEASSNTIVLTDRAGNVDRLVDIIRAMDRAK